MSAPIKNRAPSDRLPSQTPPTPPRPWFLVALIVTYTGLYTLLCWRRYQSFHAQIDLSYYLRQCWGVFHGHLDLPLVQAPHVLGLHLEPVLLPLGFLGWLGVPLAPLLLGVQALVVALVAWPAWHLGQRHLGARAAPYVALAALLYPTVTVATLHDFHPVTLALAPLLGFVDALDQGRLRRALGWGALALLCREDIALQLALALYAYALPWGRTPVGAIHSNKVRLAVVVLATFLVAYFLTYIVAIQPRYLPKFGSYGLHFSGIPVAKGESVSSGRDMLLTLLRHPLALLGLMVSAERIGYVVQLLWPVGFLALLAPRALCGALPILAINFLSSFPRVRNIESHYTTAMVPFVFGAAVIGAGQLRIFLHQRRLALHPQSHSRPDLGLALAVVLLTLTTGAHVLHGGSPLAVFSTRFAWTNFTDDSSAAELRAKIALVPATASVAARPGPLAHLCLRPRTISPPEYDDGQPVDVILTPDAAPVRRQIGGAPLH